jgi:hypothetical protein
LKILVFLKGFGCSGHRQFLSELFWKRTIWLQHTNNWASQVPNHQ